MNNPEQKFVPSIWLLLSCVINVLACGGKKNTSSKAYKKHYIIKSSFSHEHTHIIIKFHISDLIPSLGGTMHSVCSFVSVVRVLF